MIGVVLVSHSGTLVEGVRELLAQMAPDVTVAVAGGDDDDGIGTSFEKISAALDEADDGDGAVVLYDLGSAKLTTEMVVEMLEPERAQRVLLVDAPLVEGALAAATSITPEADVSAIAAIARAAGHVEPDDVVEGKGPGPAGDGRVAGGPAGDDAAAEPMTRTIALRNPLGLHARPAGAVVRAIASLRADVQLAGEGGRADARSMLGLVGLAATGGDEVTITASGDEAQVALDRIVALIEDGFGEEAPGVPGSVEADETPAWEQRPDPRLAGPNTDANTVVGQSAAPGGTIGPAVAFAHPEPDLDTTAPGDVEAERHSLDAAIAQAQGELDGSEGSVSEGMATPDDAGAIFAAHRELLADPALVGAAREAIDQDTNALQAWWRSVTRQRKVLQSIGTAVVAARAADVQDVGHRVLRALGVSSPPFTPAAGAVVIAGDVTPSQLMGWHEAGIAAVVTSAGSPTAHAAIIARSLGVPMVTGTGPALHGVADGTPVLVDADEGRVIVDPGDDVRARFGARMEQAAERRRRLREAAHEPVLRPDGTAVRIGANVATAADARAAVANGAEEVGLLRTEFWFTERPDIPSEEEQMAALAEVLDALGPRPAVVRTMDVGGDKRAPALGLDAVRNGFLGQRGIRWCLEHADVFQPHLRAILRAGAGHRLRIMFPFVTTVDEVRAAKRALRAAIDGLKADGLPHSAPEQVGIMLEIPGAALRAREFADEVDFVSIGTNDLVQYLTAADRTVAEVAHLATPEQAGLIDVVATIVRATAGAGVWVGVCGEVAADPAMAAALVEVGVEELSMTPAAIPEVKWRLREGPPRGR